MNFKIMQTLYTFDKSKTTLMKAVLPFIIIIHHLSNHFLDTAWIHPFYYAGISVVILFFLYIRLWYHCLLFEESALF